MPNHKSDQSNINPQNNFKKREKRPPRKISEIYLHNSALYYLERFSASKKHFIFVMQRKVKRSCMYHSDQDYDKCAGMVVALADKFEKSGLLDDGLYINSLVNSMRRKGISRSGIINKAYAKGISQEKTIEALEKLDNDLYESEEEAEQKAALRLARKKRIGPYFTGEEQNIKRSLGIFARAGFSYQTAKSVLDMDIINEY